MTLLRITDPFDPSRVERVLLIGAHSDDIEIGCGGTILAMRDRAPGVALDWVVLSAAGERRDEAEASAHRFGEGADLTVTVASFRERYFPHQAEIKEFFDELGRRPSPDVVLAPRIEDAHQDHRVVGELVRNTFRDNLILHYEIAKYDGDLGRPNVYVPLSAKHVTQKSDLLFEGFPSQHHRPWFDRRAFEGIMRVRGVECHAPSGFAEAFHCDRLVMDAYTERGR